jgi:hypothetical protein
MSVVFTVLGVAGAILLSLLLIGFALLKIFGTPNDPNQDWLGHSE